VRLLAEPEQSHPEERSARQVEGAPRKSQLEPGDLRAARRSGKAGKVDDGQRHGLREADDRIVSDEKQSGRTHANWEDADCQTPAPLVYHAYLAAKDPWLQRQFHIPLGLGDRPFVVGRRPLAEEGLPPRQPDLLLDDTAPFRLSRNHFIIEKRDRGYHVRDLRSTLGTIVNGVAIGDHFRTDDALLQAGENEVIAGGMDSPFVFSVSIL